MGIKFTKDKTGMGVSIGGNKGPQAYVSTFNDSGKGVSAGVSYKGNTNQYGVAGSVGTRGVTKNAYKRNKYGV